MNQLKAMLDQLVNTGIADPKILKLIEQATRDPSKLDEVLSILGPLSEDLEKPLIIEDYYEEGDGQKFELRWPIGQGNPLSSMGIPFESLDRKTQFFTLFSEWQRRETEGMMALNNGDSETAEEIFKECLARADQIEVGELRARSYEGLMRVAEKIYGQEEVFSLLEQARDARANAG